MNNKNKYNLLTCITMIVGVVIGSGIFFKSDNILEATNGNILLGALAFFIAAISIIFGSLSIAQLASRTNKPGGVITYTEQAYNNGFACSIGWFQALLYYPTSIAVVCSVVGIYFCMLFGINTSLEFQLYIGIVTALLIYIMNVVFSKIAGYFQAAATFIKLIPLVLIGIAGFVFGNPSLQLSTSIETISTSNGWITALIPIVFTFDGWIVATSISHEVKNSEKNVPIALIAAPLIILSMYLLYFIGISIYLGPDEIRLAGDNHVALAAEKLMGPWGAKAILVFVIISVSATANGLMTGLFQLPYSLSLRDMLPYSDKVRKISKKWNVPVVSYTIGLIIVLFWIIVHYITQKYNIMPNSDVSEIGITLNYILFIPLYYHVLRLGTQGEIKGIWKSRINPILAILGSLIILYVGLQNKLFIVYVLICSIILIGSYRYYINKNKYTDDDSDIDSIVLE